MSDTMGTERKPFHWRGLTSLVVTLAFLVLAATGVILYVAPQGRVANWTGWAVLHLGKEEWAAVHTTAALLFIVASGFHVYFNWSTLARYFVLKRRLHLKREMIGATVVVAAVFAGTVMRIPPLGSVGDLNDRIKAHWESRSAQAPYPHAEAALLSDFCEQTGIAMPVLLERLERAGITVEDPSSQTLGDLARARGLAPNELFAGISGESAGGSSGSEGHGAGLGRRTVRDICDDAGIDLERALEALEREGYTVDASTTLKALAEQKGGAPAEIRDLIVEKGK
jgi:hypothetical protein